MEAFACVGLLERVCIVRVPKGTMAAGSHVAQKRWQRGVIALDDAMAAVAQTGDQLKVNFVLNDMVGAVPEDLLFIRPDPQRPLANLISSLPPLVCGCH